MRRALGRGARPRRWVQAEAALRPGARPQARVLWRVRGLTGAADFRLGRPARRGAADGPLFASTLHPPSLFACTLCLGPRAHARSGPDPGISRTAVSGRFYFYCFFFIFLSNFYGGAESSVDQINPARARKNRTVAPRETLSKGGLALRTRRDPSK